MVCRCLIFFIDSSLDMLGNPPGKTATRPHENKPKALFKFGVIPCISSAKDYHFQSSLFVLEILVQ